MTCSVREATLDDLPAILAELKLFEQFYDVSYKMYETDEQAETVIRPMITDHLFLVSVTPEQKITGFISGMFLPHVYNPKVSTLVETFWWVNPEYRNTKAGSMLLNKFVEIGRSTVDVIIGVLENDSPVNESTFLRRGFKLKEKTYILEV